VNQRLVVDASIALAWSLDDETDHRADEALAIVEQSGALVPTLWTYEIANSLTHFVRRARIDGDRAQTILAALGQLHIVTVAPEAPAWFAETNALALKHALTIYDASYLHLAIASKGRLASADKKLQAAAHAEGAQF
jgi:predicted nucleic acid-binding protein